jgi:hypothetical protein
MCVEELLLAPGLYPTAHGVERGHDLPLLLVFTFFYIEVHQTRVISSLPRHNHPHQPQLPIIAARTRVENGDAKTHAGVAVRSSVNGTANRTRAYPTAIDTAADTHMRAAFDKPIAEMRGYEAALSEPSLSASKEAC